MTARADQHSCANRAVEQPTVLLSLDRFQRLPESQRGAGSLEEIIVELAATYAVADCFVVHDVVRDRDAQSRDECADRLQSSIASIFAYIQLQRFDDLRCDP